MAFNIKVGTQEYFVEPVGSEKLHYTVRAGQETYDLKLSAHGEWICNRSSHGAYPIPVDEIGAAIKKYYRLN